MINFTKRYVNTVSLIISIIVFVFFNNSVLSVSKINSNNFLESNYQKNQIEGSSQTNVQAENKNNVIKSNVSIAKNETKTKENKTKNTVNWQLEIPKINLKAEIMEGTTKEIMDQYVGHFEETSKEKGNVGLAAHNRGYKVNYFQDLKKLKEGDEIFYTYNGKKRKYIVKIHKIIKDTDWTLLEKTEENRITLITCVENEPEYRRCIQGIEIK